MDYENSPKRSSFKRVPSDINFLPFLLSPKFSCFRLKTRCRLPTSLLGFLLSGPLSRSNLTLSASLLVWLSHRLFSLWSNWRQICKSRAQNVKNAWDAQNTRVQFWSFLCHATLRSWVASAAWRQSNLCVGTSDRLDFRPLFEKGARVPLLAKIEFRLPTAAKYLGKSRTLLSYGTCLVLYDDLSC